MNLPYGNIEKQMAIEKIEILENRIKELQAELREYKSLFNMQRKCDLRAQEMWRKSTGEELTIPDGAKLSVWLLEQLEKFKWFPIQDPVEGEWVFLTSPYWKSIKCFSPVNVGYWDKGSFVLENGHFIKPHIANGPTHYMPIPELPRSAS